MGWSFLIAYFIVVLAIGLWAARKSTEYSYLISNRDLGGVMIGFSTAAGFFDAFVMVTFTSYVYKYGWPALSLFVGTALGLVLYSFFASSLRAEAGLRGFYGMSDYFQSEYGRTAAILVSIINLIFYISLLLVQLIVVTEN